MMIRSAIKNITIAIVGFATLFTLAIGVPTVVNAQSAQQQACQALPGQTWDAASNTCGDSTNKLNAVIGRIIAVFSVIVGIAAVIMIIYAGFLYITAAGDTNKLTTARHSITYSIIGIVIVVLAQIIVRFALNVTV